jgi:hypothetical protein
VFLSLVAGTLAALGLLTFAAKSIAQGIDAPQRIAFQISTGSTTGSYFPVDSFSLSCSAIRPVSAAARPRMCAGPRA